MFYCLLAFGQLLILNGIVAVNESSLEVDEWPKSVSMVRSVRAPLATIHSINKPVEPLYTITHTTTAQKTQGIIIIAVSITGSTIRWCGMCLLIDSARTATAV